jgi:hypothetical protein
MLLGVTDRGGLAEFMTAPASSIYVLPAGLTARCSSHQVEFLRREVEPNQLGGTVEDAGHPDAGRPDEPGVHERRHCCPVTLTPCARS